MMAAATHVIQYATFMMLSNYPADDTIDCMKLWRCGTDP